MTRDDSLVTTLVQVFARAPVLGEVKTRLIADVGPQRALDVYMQLLNFTLNQAQASGFALEIWMQGSNLDAMNAAIAASGLELPVRMQTGKDLGERMFRALSDGRKRYDQVLLIGSDCIDLSPGRLQQAAATLQEGADVVLGPSADGGYYLVAPARPCAELFAEVPWGSAEVWQQSLQRIEALNWQLATLPVGHDLDVIEDLERAMQWEVIQ